MTCAEPPKLSASRLAVHVKKKKTRNDVCGAAQAIRKPPRSTRQKEKTRNDVCGAAQAIRKMPHSTRQKGKSKK